MKIHTLPLGPLQTNCYILAGHSEAVVVDPGGEPSAVLDYLNDNNLKLTHILNTHLHFDHTYGNKALSDATAAPVICSKEDLYLLETELGQGGMFGLPPVDKYDYQTIVAGSHTFAGFHCEAFLTPGHSRGSLTFHFPEAKTAFVGDLIFYRSIGRTDFEGGDQNELMTSVKTSIFTLPPETVLLSGHGPETTVGDEMNHNPFFTGF
jgi:glyoxylase-like metal-dependent hydrolase (beta-lactamase superfamily II)